MVWRILSVLVATIGFCGSLMAQNAPFHGIWRESGEQGYQGARETHLLLFLPASDGLTRISVTVHPDNRANVEIHPVVFDGKPHATTGGDAREITYKRSDANTIERTQNRNGRISADTQQVSTDGKTLTIRQENGTRTFEKQFDIQEVRR
jgi:hypothetical protein